jgi:hypothetical protein
MWTKQDLIEQAFAEIGLAVDVFNVAPEQLARALNSLDALMATWHAKGLRLGYALPSTPGSSNLDDDSGLPDGANEAAFLNLALRIAPSVGKQVLPATQIAAKEALDVLMLGAAFPASQQLPGTLPQGAGNKPWRSQQPFFPAPAAPLEAALGADPLTFD